MTWKELKYNNPENGKTYDVWAKSWDPETDKFRTRRFADVKYCRFVKEGRKPIGQHAHWESVDQGWFVTHYMDIPPPPIEPAEVPVSSLPERVPETLDPVNLELDTSDEIPF